MCALVDDSLATTFSIPELCSIVSTPLKLISATGAVTYNLQTPDQYFQYSLANFFESTVTPSQNRSDGPLP